MKERITLDHGSGGLASKELVERLLPHLGADPQLRRLEDAAELERPAGRIAFSTDSFVVQPLRFPGGDIGALAVHGTINDLAMRGARPLALSLGLILEEGVEAALLVEVASSIGRACAAAGVTVVTGDTKVVERGKADRIFVNTSGIGVIPDGVRLAAQRIAPGDAILLSGTVGDHGVTVLASRFDLELPSEVRSDSQPLHRLVAEMLAAAEDRVHALRDPRPDDISPFYDADHREWYAVTVKGAPDVVLNLCSHYQQMDDQALPLDEAMRRRIAEGLGAELFDIPGLTELYGPGTGMECSAHHHGNACCTRCMV